MSKIRRLIAKAMVLLFIALFIFPMLNSSVTVHAAENYQYVTQWGSYGSGPGQFNEPLGVAVDSSGNVYVADWGSNNRVQKFTSNGGFILSWGGTGSGNGQFNNPGQIAVDSSGNVYVADAANNRVQKFTSNGAFVSSLGGFFNPIGIAVDSSGNVYVLDSYNDRVVKFTGNGVLITSWGTSSAGWCDAVDSSGNVYVVEPYINLVEKFTSTGVFITSWGGGGSGNGQFSNPTGIATDSQDNVYVTDTYNHRVQKFTSSGVFITQWSIAGSGWGVAVDSSGNVYVTDYSNICVQKFSMQGNPNPAPAVAWSQTYNGISLNGANSVVQTNDGGYALTGSADVANNISTTIWKPWLIKTDSNGMMLWNQTYTEGLDYIEPYSLAKTSDGGYMILCGTNTNVGNPCYRLIKTDSNGNMLWNKTYAVNQFDALGSVIQTTDGGYAFIGTMSQLGNSNSYAMLIKTDSQGNMLWNKTYGGLYSNEADSFVQNIDGGYTITGASSPSGNNEAWLFRTDLNGNILWSKTYGMGLDASSNRLILTSDGGYAFGGTTGPNYFGTLWKTDANGNQQWNQTYVGANYYGVFSLCQTKDGGFALMGSPGNGTALNLLVRTDSSGKMLWDQSYSQYLSNAQINAMILTNDGCYAFAGSVVDNSGNSSPFLMKTDPEQNTSTTQVLQIGNLVVGNPANSTWNCKVTDNATGNVISEFTLPAAGTSGSYTNTVQLSNGGSYIVFEEPQLGYHTSMQINASQVDSFQFTVNVNAGDSLQVLFNNTALAPGSLELPPPSSMNFSIPPLTLIPIQAAWNPDANNDGTLDLVVNKTMAIIINFTVPVNPTDIVNLSVKFDQQVFTKTVYGAILQADSIIPFCPITPKNLGNKALNGTYQINSASPINFPSLTVKVRQTTDLPLVYGYFTRSNYGTVSQTEYSQMANTSTVFIKATYPVTNVPVNESYIGLAGNSNSGGGYSGATKDLSLVLGPYAKSHMGQYTNAIGIAIEPASYFTYNGLTGGAGWTPNQNTKASLVLDGGYTEAAHEVGHSFGLYIGAVPEYYLIPGLAGTNVSGVYPDIDQWRTGLDIMDRSSQSGNNWASTGTYNQLFNWTRGNFTDPDILIASGIIYKNGTVDLSTSWLEVSQGIPDIIAPGNYSLQFLAANGTVLGSITFDAQSPLNYDGAPFCFATVYPKGTSYVNVLNTANQAAPPKTLATVQAEDIVKLNNSVTFAETGLPLGTSWSVTLGSKTLSSTNSTIAFTGLAYGNYDWNSSTEISGGAGIRYDASVASGTIDVEGNVSSTIAYITQYQVSLAVDPSGAGSANPASANYYNVGTQIPISAAANDQYQFLDWSSNSPSIVLANVASPSTSATINGPGTVTCAFASTIGNSVAFAETGLPSGKPWNVTLGGQTLSSTTGAIVFTNLASGSYSWSTPSIISGSTGTRYAASITSGTLNVAGQTSTSITYTTQYQVSFTMNTVGSGVINPATVTFFDSGSKISISATPKPGFTLYIWSSNTPSITFTNSSAATTTATITGPGTVTANFALLVGGNKQITLTGSNNAVIITGGSNQINAVQASATTIVKTGAGNNIINLGNGNNKVIETADGNDIISTGNGDNVLSILGNGNNQITTGSGNDVIQITGNGNNIIKAGDGDNQVTVKGYGNNQITAGSGSDVIVAGDGNNIIKAGDGNNKVTLGKGNNLVTTGTGGDEVTVGNGNNNIQTGAGDDTITVGKGNNYVDGGADYDICLHGTGNNTILNCEKGVIAK